MISDFRYEVEYDEHRIIIAHDIGRRFLDINVPSATFNNGNEQAAAAQQQSPGQKLSSMETTATVDVDNNDDGDIAKESNGTADGNGTATSDDIRRQQNVETEFCNNSTTITTLSCSSRTAAGTNHSASNASDKYKHHNGDEVQQNDITNTTVLSSTEDGNDIANAIDVVKLNDTGGSKSPNNCNGNVSTTTATTNNRTSSSCTSPANVPAHNTMSSRDEFVLDILNDDLISRVRSKLSNGGKDLFEPCVKSVKAFLAGEPFREFEDSMYFHR